MMAASYETPPATPPESTPQPEKWMIKINDSTTELWFKVRPTRKVSQLLNAWCQMVGVPPHTARVLLDGQRIVLGENTLADVGLGDRSAIEVYYEQLGGATTAAEDGPELNQAHAASPSPPPQAPTAMTPGHRATSFLVTLDKTLAHTVKAITYDHFAACFPNIARNAPETLKWMHGNMQQLLLERSKSDFETIVQDRNVVANLNSLEDLIGAAQRRKARSADDDTPAIAPHLLPARVVASAHLASLYASQQSQLNARLQTVESQNATLFEQIQAQKREMEVLMKGLEAAEADVDKTIEALGPEVVDTLAQDSRTAEAKLMETA
ncbi:mind kinetochore complex component [Phlyctema vagabunda]|uniref:Mind kinetochore complex component n=1 Tax=Phlyctema vagabunda TaxID=108571 RepID=A0ABR4PQ42_9HELO